MHTFLSLWFSSEGASPVEISVVLSKMGFETMHGNYDFSYKWENKPSVDELLRLGNSIQRALVGSQALFKMETI